MADRDLYEVSYRSSSPGWGKDYSYLGRSIQGESLEGMCPVSPGFVGGLVHRIEFLQY